MDTPTQSVVKKSNLEGAFDRLEHSNSEREKRLQTLEETVNMLRSRLAPITLPIGPEESMTKEDVKGDEMPTGLSQRISNIAFEQTAMSDTLSKLNEALLDIVDRIDL